MTNDANVIELDLASGESGRVAGAIAELHQRLLTQRTIPVRPPPDETLAGLPNGDNDDLLVQYLKVLDSYPFEPPLTGKERLARIIDVVLRYGGSYAARNLSLRLVTGQGPTAALRHIAEGGVRAGQEQQQAGWLMSYLLDDLDARAATIDGLRAWVGQPVLSDLLTSAGPWLTPAERAVLGLPEP